MAPPLLLFIGTTLFNVLIADDDIWVSFAAMRVCYFMFVPLALHVDPKKVA